MVYDFLDKNSVTTHTKVGANSEKQQLVGELHKPIIRNFKKREEYSFFKDKIWGVDPADMDLISEYNNGISNFIICY